MLNNDGLNLPIPHALAGEDTESRIQLERLCVRWERLSVRYQELRGELSRFRDRYYGVMGPILVELDGLELHLLKLDAVQEILQRVPGMPERELIEWVKIRVKDRVASLTRLRQDLEDSRRRCEERRDDDQLTAKDRTLMRRLYRRLAKVYHPDLQATEEGKEECEAIMACINELYAVGDLECLEMVFEEGPRVAACPFSNKADYQNWLRSRVVRLKQRILGLEEDLAGLTGSDLAVLRNRIADAQREGRDLLAEMAKDWEAQITNKRQDLADQEQRMKSLRPTVSDSLLAAFAV